MGDAPVLEQPEPQVEQPQHHSKRAQLSSLLHNVWGKGKDKGIEQSEQSEQPKHVVVQQENPEKQPEPQQEKEEEPEPQSKRAQLTSLLSNGWGKSKERGIEQPQTPEQPEAQEEQPEDTSKRSQLNSLLQTGWEMGKEKSIEQLLKGKLTLEHTLGLGKKPNVIPSGEASIDGDHRVVEIGWHPVAGMGGKWLAEKSGLGKMITKEIGKYPDPTQHWGVLVGEYVHELWMDENLDVVYINEVLVREEWRTFEVGKTRFTDEALRQAGEMVIHNMRVKRPAYNIISNNCQNFATLLLDAIQIGAHKEFATSFAVYQRATGSGSIKDLFEDKHPEEQKVDAVSEEGLKLHRMDTVQNAEQVMHDNTTQLDNHRALFQG